MKTIGVVRFLGTNCDQDVFDALQNVGLKAKWLWYQDQFKESEVDGVVIPGGFSYGDYLRCGALASKMPVMDGVKALAQKGKPVLGICNGFQVLCESGLLPGVLMRNKSLKFIDDWSNLNSVHTSGMWELKSDRIDLPIAHGEGCYYAPKEQIETLFENNQVWLTYKNNPNGSIKDIAGVLNKTHNVAGLMPHPERAMHSWLGGTDGRAFLERFS